MAAGTLPVSGFTLVDARGAAPDPDLGPIEDGATVDVGPADGQVSIRADLAYSSGIGSVRLELTGPVSVTRVEQAAPFSLFGNDRRGDYYAGRLRTVRTRSRRRRTAAVTGRVKRCRG